MLLRANTWVSFRGTTSRLSQRDRKADEMEIISSFWGLSLNQTVFCVVAILVVVDFFMPHDVPTHIAYILLCCLVAINIHANILIQILCALVSWFAFVAFHYWIWRGVVQRVVNNFIAPDRFKAGADGIIGENGEIRFIEGKKMVRVKGDLWPCHHSESLKNGDIVTIVANNSGVLETQKTERNT